VKTVILGAGLMGVTTAWELAKTGREVTVIEREAVPASGSSHANAGLVAPGHSLTWASPRAPRILLKSLFQGDQALRLKLNADPHMWAWCLKFLGNCTAEKYRRNSRRKLTLCAYSQQIMRDLVAATGIEYDGIRKGLLYLYRDAEALEGGLAAMAILREGGQAMEVLDAAGIARVEPAFATTRAPIAGGIFCPNDESGDARKFTMALAEKCREAGVAFRFGTTVTGLDAAGDVVSAIRTDQGAVAADEVVLALGCWSPLLARKLGLSLPVYPVKGYSATIPLDGHNGAPEVGGVDEHNLMAWCRMGDRLRITATAEFTGYDTSHRPEDFAGMLRVAQTLFPDAGDYARPTYWAGLRPMTPEGTPIFGRGRHKNLWLNTGHGHMGWTMACGSARICADLMDGRAPAIDMAGMIYGQAA
jgi:D-amino-acid dehydrogenase